MQLYADVFEDRNDNWVWEVADEDGIFLRSERAFADKHIARADLENSTYLVNHYLDAK